MKPLSKLFLRVAAVLPIVAFVAWQVYRDCFTETINSYHSLTYDYLWGIVMGINLLCISLSCFVIYHQRNCMPEADKPFRIVTYITAGWLAFCLLFAALSGFVRVGGLWMIYIPVWMRAVVIVLLSTWLWMLSNRKGEGTLSKPIAVLALCGGILALMVIVLMIIAGIYILLNGHVYNGGIGTFAYYQWVKTFVPLVVIGSYAISIMRKK